MGVIAKRDYQFDAHVKLPTAAGNQANPADRDIWIDTAAGKLGFRLAGATVLVPLASEISSSLTQEQLEDFVAALIQDNADLDWTYDDPSGSIVGIIKNDVVTFAKLQNASNDARVIGRASGAGGGDFTELTGAQIRTILGTLDADTLNGSSAAAIAASAVNTILNGAGAAYDTLLEIQALLQADDTADAALVTAVGLRSRFAYITVPNGASPQNIVHGMGLANIHAWTGEIVNPTTGARPEYDLVASDGNTIVITDDTGSAIPTGLKFVGHFGV